MEETLEYVNFSENAVGGWDAENLLDSIEIEGLSSDTKAANKIKRQGFSRRFWRDCRIL